MHLAEIIFIDIAYHPHLREIGDGKQIGTVVEALDPLESGNVLLDDGARRPEREFRSASWDGPDRHPICERVVRRSARPPELSLPCPRLLQIFLCQRAMRVEQLRPVQGFLAKRSSATDFW